jgi:hypothetical protein
VTRDRHSRLIVALFCVAAVSAMWQMAHSPAAGLAAQWEAPAIARNLAAGRGFSNPYGAFESGPTAHLPPLFPGILAALLLVCGDTLAFAYAAVLLAVLTQALYCVLFIPLSAEIFQDRRPGIAAAVFSALVPTIEPLPQWEAIYAAVGLQLFCLATARWARSGVLAGLLCGVLLLLNPALLPVALAWMVYRKTRPRQWAAFAAAAALALLPWTARTRATGSTMPAAVTPCYSPIKASRRPGRCANWASWRTTATAWRRPAAGLPKTPPASAS